MTERITALLEEHKLTQLKELLNEDLGFQELSELLEQYPPNQQAVLFRLLDKDTALEIFEVMEPAQQRGLLEAFTATEVTELFSGIDPSDQVRLLGELPAKVAKELLKSVPRETRDSASILMGFQPGTVGRVMSPHYLRLRRDDTVGSALERIRKIKPDREALLDIWVTDKHRIMEGVVTLRDLVLAEPEAAIGDIMDDDVVFVTADTDQEDAVNILKKFDLVSLPVVDSESRLVGVLEHDRALDIMQEEATEDLLETGGVLTLQKREENLSQRLINGSILQVIRLRLPFLFITLAGSMLAGLVISSFQTALKSTIALAFFLPIVMDMGGNVGNQSSTIFTRSLVLGQVKVNSFIRPLLNELARGAVIGLVMGSATSLIAVVWQREPIIGVVVGLSLFFTISLAATLGFLVPWTLYKLNYDQAAGASPLITTIVAVTGLLIYFVLASVFMI